MWITGLPASGKSTLASALARALSARGIDAALLESDTLRRVLAPQPTCDEAGRNAFYRAMTFIGGLLTRHGVPVVFDATGNPRRYREAARREIAGLVEVFVDCPLAVCMARDPKGIYARARHAAAATVPGVQAPYEPPQHPDLVVAGDTEAPDAAAARIVRLLERRGALPGSSDPAR